MTIFLAFNSANSIIEFSSIREYANCLSLFYFFCPAVFQLVGVDY